MEPSKLRRRKPQSTQDESSASEVVNISLSSVQAEVSSQPGIHNHHNVSGQIENSQHSENSVPTPNEPTTDANFFEAAPQPIVLVDDTKIEELRAELRGN